MNRIGFFFAFELKYFECVSYSTNLCIFKHYTDKFDITNVIKNGGNTLTIEIANIWSNRLTGDAITGEKYTDTNILNTIVPGSNIWLANKTRVPWAKVPLLESGLLGPVSIQTFNLVR